MCSRSFVFSFVSMCFRSATVSPLWFRSFPNSQPLEAIAPCSLESRHYSLLFPRFPALLLSFYIVFTLFCARISSDVPPLRILSLVIAHFSRVYAHSTGLCVCLRSFTWTKLLYIHLTTSSPLRDFSVTFVTLTDRYLFRIRSDFPQWALAHQVRVLCSRDTFRGIQRSCMGFFIYFHSSLFPFRSILSLFIDKFGIIQI